MLKSKEYYELMAQFEKEFKGYRLDKEAKELWQRGIIYQDGHLNEIFKAYQKGYAFGKVIGRND